MSDPTQEPRQTTKVMAAVQAAHGNAATLPRYILGSLLLAVSIGEYIWHVATHAAGETGNLSEFRTMGIVFFIGFVTIPGVAEGSAAGVSAFGGALVSLWERIRKPKAA